MCIRSVEVLSAIIKKTILESIVAVTMSFLLYIFPVYQTDTSGAITLMPMLPLFVLTLRWGGLESLPAIIITSVLCGVYATRDIYIIVLYFIIPYLNIALTDFYKSPKKPKLEYLILSLFQLYLLIFVTRLIASYYLYSSYYQRLGLKGMIFANGEYLLIEFVITAVGAVVMYFLSEKIYRFQK